MRIYDMDSPYIPSNIIWNTQHEMYEGLKRIYANSPRWGRLGAILVVPLDVGLDALGTPIWIIQALAMAAINIVGMNGDIAKKMDSLLPMKKVRDDQKSPTYSFKAALAHIDNAFRTIFQIPVVGFMAPFKFAYQLSVTLYDPANATSIARI